MRFGRFATVIDHAAKIRKVAALAALLCLAASPAAAQVPAGMWMMPRWYCVEPASWWCPCGCCPQYAPYVDRGGYRGNTLGYHSQIKASSMNVDSINAMMEQQLKQPGVTPSRQQR